MAYTTPQFTRQTGTPQFRPIYSQVTPPAPLTPQQRIAQLTPQQRVAFTQWIQRSQNPQTPMGPQGGPAPAPGSTFVLPGSAEAEFLGQRQNANEAYMEGQANVNYAQANAGIQHGRDVADQRRAWIQARSTFAEPYANRGVMASGMYKRGLTDATAGWERQKFRTEQDFRRQQAGFNLQRTQLENRHVIAISNLRQKHAAVLGEAAARSVK